MNKGEVTRRRITAKLMGIVELEVSAGDYLPNVIAKAQEIAREQERAVVFLFNNVYMEVFADDNIRELDREYERRLSERHP